MRGRKPIPTCLKVIAGNRGRRPLNEREPRIDGGLPPPPPHLSLVALAEWKRLAPALERTGQITGGDYAMFSCYCQAWSDLCEAEARVVQYGKIMKGSKGQITKSALLRIRDDAREQVRKFAAELGLSPSSRSRVHATPPAVDDPAAKKYLG
jgi:P27 family predicted phage terminase small subunit